MYRAHEGGSPGLLESLGFCLVVHIKENKKIKIINRLKRERTCDRGWCLEDTQMDPG